MEEEDWKEWKFIEEYEDRYMINKSGLVYSIKYDKFLAVQVTYFYEYPHVQLWMYNVPKTHSVHILVLTTFKGKCPEGMEANHKNGNKEDYYFDNLEWLTHSENIKHAYDTGLIRRKND